jgi:hypothetical protein
LEKKDTKVYSVQVSEGTTTKEIYRFDEKERKNPAPRMCRGSPAGAVSSPYPAEEAPTGAANARRLGDGDLIW